MYKNMAIIHADKMAWNEHNQQLDAQIKIQITMPSRWEHRTDMHNTTKNR